MASETPNSQTKNGNEENNEMINLEFDEVLHLLSKRAVLGRGIPDKYDGPPWRLPSDIPKYEEINRLLQHSMMAQSASIPDSEEFQQFVLSNSSLAVAALLRQYLSVIQVSSDITFGVLLWEQAARSGSDDFEGTPHVWLNIAGNPIDNNHVAFPANADNTEYFYECKRLNAYSQEDPLNTSLRLYLGSDDDEMSREIVRHNLRVLHTFSSPGHVTKYLAVCLKHAELNPGVKMYHMLMVNWVRHTWGKEVEDIEKTMAVKCWACSKVAPDPNKLKTCTDCKVARYCNRECQRQEWRVHKLLHKELDHTKEVLEKNEREELEEDELIQREKDGLRFDPKNIPTR